MAKSLNMVQLIGNMGKAAEGRFTPSGKNVSSFSMAMNSSWNDASGQKVEKTEWVNLEIWGKGAEILTQYTDKGSKLYIEGRLTTDKYEDAGVTKYFTKVVVNNFILLDQKGDHANVPVAGDPAEGELVYPEAGANTPVPVGTQF